MFVIEDGIKVHGISQQNWHARMICLVRTSFDQTILEPAYNTHKCLFMLPPFRGREYSIHILETGEALMRINGRMYFCTRQNGKPIVITFTDVSIKRSTVQAVA